MPPWIGFHAGFKRFSRHLLRKDTDACLDAGIAQHIRRFIKQPAALDVVAEGNDIGEGMPVHVEEHAETILDRIHDMVDHGQQDLLVTCPDSGVLPDTKQVCVRLQHMEVRIHGFGGVQVLCC